MRNVFPFVYIHVKYDRLSCLFAKNDIHIKQKNPIQIQYNYRRLCFLETNQQLTNFNNILILTVLKCINSDV